jgi:hypothetical protein
VRRFQRVVFGANHRSTSMSTMGAAWWLFFVQVG